MKTLRRAVLAVLLLGVLPAAAQSRARAPLIPGGDSKAPISINADRLEYFNNEHKLVYSGNVLARQGTATLKASTLVIQLAASGATGQHKASAGLLPSAGSQDVRRMEATGPVTIIQNGEVGIGDHAVYDKVANKVYLIGHVSLSQGTNITRGDKLVYNLTTNQAEVEGGRVQSIFTPGSVDEGASGNGSTISAEPPRRSTNRERRGAVAQSKDAR